MIKQCVANHNVRKCSTISNYKYVLVETSLYYIWFFNVFCGVTSAASTHIFDSNFINKIVIQNDASDVLILLIIYLPINKLLFLV